MKTRLISDGQALKYYDILKTKILNDKCSVQEISGFDKDKKVTFYGFYDPESYLIEVGVNRSPYVMLIVLAHEYGHFLDYLRFFKNYGKRAYDRYIKKVKFRQMELITSETNAWFLAEGELSKLDKDICLDYRFFIHKDKFLQTTIDEYYQRKYEKKWRMIQVEIKL